MMHWIHNYQLFLFDFDGLLVNTETLHFQAYIRMCAQRNHHLDWTFQTFSDAAHHSATGLRDQVYASLPLLYAEQPDWNILYAEKKQAFLDILREKPISLMSGVAHLLTALAQAKIKSCVVTNSPFAVINLIRQQNPLLNLIPYWVTRENYSLPKPDPGCYHYAIEKYAQPDDKIIGFEDSPKGLQALMNTRAKPVLICPPDSSYLNEISLTSVKYYPNLDFITDQDHP